MMRNQRDGDKKATRDAEHRMCDKARACLAADGPAVQRGIECYAILSPSNFTENHEPARVNHSWRRTHVLRLSFWWHLLLLFEIRV